VGVPRVPHGRHTNNPWGIRFWKCFSTASLVPGYRDRKRLACGRPKFDDVCAVSLRAVDHDPVLDWRAATWTRRRVYRRVGAGDYKNAPTSDSRYEAFTEAGKPVETASIPPLPKPTPLVEPPPPRRRVRTQVRAPNLERDDPGEIIEGYLDVRDGILYVWNEEDTRR
jgi:hypothetical protein